MTLFDRGGAPRLYLRQLERRPTPSATGADSQIRLRVHREGGELFVLDPIGVRLGTLIDGSPARVARIYDRQQTPWGTVESRGPDQAVRDPEGTTFTWSSRPRLRSWPACSPSRGWTVANSFRSIFFLRADFCYTSRSFLGRKQDL